jgi:uncharacterized protein YxjI
MNPVLNRNLFFVKEYVGMFKAANEFDVQDPETREVLMQCREPNLGFFTKLFRFSEYKRMTPFDIQITTPDGKPILQIKRKFTLFLSSVEVLDEYGKCVGRFKQKFFSIGGAFRVLDANDVELCELKGKWTGWDFKFVKDKAEFAHVTKKWAGLGKELFSTADNYILSINEQVPADNDLRILIMAAVMCIDMVLKE